jgi:hypothetical protein
MIWTPNIKKLIIQKVSIDAIPSGGGIKAGVDFLSDKKKMLECFKNAEVWVMGAISIIKTAPDPNEFKNLSDEEIAGVLLSKIEERKNNLKREGVQK